MEYQSCTQCKQKTKDNELLFSDQGMICEACHEKNEKAEKEKFGLRNESERIEDTFKSKRLVWIFLAIVLILVNILSEFLEWGFIIY